jgi:hypothetical protein
VRAPPLGHAPTTHLRGKQQAHAHRRASLRAHKQRRRRAACRRRVHGDARSVSGGSGSGSSSGSSGIIQRAFGNTLPDKSNSQQWRENAGCVRQRAAAAARRWRARHAVRAAAGARRAGQRARAAVQRRARRHFPLRPPRWAVLHARRTPACAWRRARCAPCGAGERQQHASRRHTSGAACGAAPVQGCPFARVRHGVRSGFPRRSPPLRISCVRACTDRLATAARARHGAAGGHLQARRAAQTTARPHAQRRRWLARARMLSPAAPARRRPAAAAQRTHAHRRAAVPRKVAPRWRGRAAGWAAARGVVVRLTQSLNLMGTKPRPY